MSISKIYFDFVVTRFIALMLFYTKLTIILKTKYKLNVKFLAVSVPVYHHHCDVLYACVAIGFQRIETLNK